VDDYVYVNGVRVASIEDLGPGAFKGQTSTPLSVSPTDTLSIQVVITHGAGNNLTTGNKDVSIGVPDGGLTIVLLGMGLVGLEGLRRRLKK
jgi:VPDSG-CTERM motif